MGRKTQVNNDDQKDLIKPNMEVNIKKKKQIKLANLKAIKDMGILIDVEFKAKVK
jgi:hypothetical protein